MDIEPWYSLTTGSVVVDFLIAIFVAVMLVLRKVMSDNKKE